MIKKSDIVREAVREQDWKKALHIAKNFYIGVTQEQRSKMTRAYECIVHPDFYRQIGIDIPKAIEEGKEIVKEYAESTRRKNTMKWDVKHDKAKKVIDAFLENAANWQKTGEFTALTRADLEGELTDEEKNLVYEEMMLMITSIRKRYKLQERLPVQEAQIRSEEVGAVTPGETTEEAIPTKKAEEMLTEPVSEDKEKEKTKRTRKASTNEKKTPSKRKKKDTQEEEQV